MSDPNSMDIEKASKVLNDLGFWGASSGLPVNHAGLCAPNQPQIVFASSMVAFTRKLAGILAEERKCACESAAKMVCPYCETGVPPKEWERWDIGGGRYIHRMHDGREIDCRASRIWRKIGGDVTSDRIAGRRSGGGVTKSE